MHSRQTPDCSATSTANSCLRHNSCLRQTLLHRSVQELHWNCSGLALTRSESTLTLTAISGLWWLLSKCSPIVIQEELRVSGNCLRPTSKILCWQISCFLIFDVQSTVNTNRHITSKCLLYFSCYVSLCVLKTKKKYSGMSQECRDWKFWSSGSGRSMWCCIRNSSRLKREKRW